MKIFDYIGISSLLILTSCQAVADSSVQGKMVFNSVRSMADADNRYKADDSAYLLKDGKIAFLGKGLLNPAFSPEGTTIVCSDLQKHQVVLIDETGNIKKSIPVEYQAGKFSWSPDGKKIIFTDYSRSLNRSRIQQYDVQSGSMEVLVDQGEGASIVSCFYSPDGKQIIFNTTGSNIVGGVYVCNAGGGGIRFLRERSDPDGWFPDSKHILMRTPIGPDGKLTDGEFGSLFKFNVDTGDMQKIRDINFFALTDRAKISKDGRFIYWAKADSGGGKTIQIWPVDDPAKVTYATRPAHISASEYSEDYNPDWFQ